MVAAARLLWMQRSPDTPSRPKASQDSVRRLALASGTSYVCGAISGVAAGSYRCFTGEEMLMAHCGPTRTAAGLFGAELELPAGNTAPRAKLSEFDTMQWRFWACALRL